MEYDSAIKRSEFGSVLVRWMTLEPVTQSEVSQKEKNQCHLLVHIYGIQESGADESICRAEAEPQTERTALWTRQGKEMEE